MRPVNLASVVIANKVLSADNRDRLFIAWGIAPKPKELISLEALVTGLNNLSRISPEVVAGILGECFFGFVIPRISKEFDCLWIGDKTIVDVELKSQDVGVEAIKKQLLQNRQYLLPLQKTVVLFTFDSSSGTCYSIDANNNLVNASLFDIGKALYIIHKENLYVDDIETIFPPERYLVSPFNSTDAFLSHQYFLTGQQEDIKKKVLAFVDDMAVGNFCSITGGPGSGKSLLMYDIARTLMEAGKSIIIAHSGGLNNGHNTLINKGWHIVSTKGLVIIGTGDERDIVDADVYVIDETQRCYSYIVDTILNKVAEKGKKCIFSLDAEQVMSDGEQRYKNDVKIRAATAGHGYALTSNIRTNADVYSFVKALFDIHHSASQNCREHVEITYCQTVVEAIAMLVALQKKGYHVPKFTPILHGKADYEDWFPASEPSAHEVIGQEFDDVVGLISDKMYYNVNGKLVSRGRYLYREDRMLYQILSRARHKIHLVILNNPAILERCLKLLGC